MATKEQELKSLMTASLDGDAVAYRALLKRLSPHLRSYYRMRLARAGRGALEAEDLLQEALLAIHTRRHTYDRDQPFTPWMHAIARYKLIDYLRRNLLSQSSVPIEDHRDLLATGDQAPIRKYTRPRTVAEHRAGKDRRAIEAVKLEGKSVAETATLPYVGT